MAQRHEFRVVIEGTDLPAATADRIAQAVQTAALAELASVDVHGDFATRMLGGTTRGRQVVFLNAEQARAAGLLEGGE